MEARICDVKMFYSNAVEESTRLPVAVGMSACMYVVKSR